MPAGCSVARFYGKGIQPEADEAQARSGAPHPCTKQGMGCVDGVRSLLPGPALSGDHQQPQGCSAREFLLPHGRAGGWKGTMSSPGSAWVWWDSWGRAASAPSQGGLWATAEQGHPTPLTNTSLEMLRTHPKFSGSRPLPRPWDKLVLSAGVPALLCRGNNHLQLQPRL